MWVFDAASPRRAFRETPGHDDAEVAVPLLPGKRFPGEYRQEAQVSEMWGLGGVMGSGLGG